MVTSKCLAVLYLLITLPTATPISPAPASRPAATRAMMGASSFSVAASSSWRGRGPDADRDRAAFGVGEQPVLDLQPAFLAVPGVAALSQRAARAFHPRR